MNNRTGRRKTGRSIFWRLLLRSVQVNRPQTALGAGSLLIGAAVCSLLLNLYGGVQQKMTDSFRAFGPNVILTPRSPSSGGGGLSSLMDEPPLERLQALKRAIPGLEATPVLYAVTQLSKVPADPRIPNGEEVLAAGSDLAALARLNPSWHVTGQASAKPGECAVGGRLAASLGLRPGSTLRLDPVSAASAQQASATFRVSTIISAGSPEDDRVFVPLEDLRRMAGAAGKVSAVEMHVPGTARQIRAAVDQLVALYPKVDVRPVRQIIYSEGRVLGAVRRLAAALTILILVIIGLCVAATMTAIMIERRKDVAIMKALGAGEPLIMRLFVTEGAVLGAAGGILGFFLGVWLARELAMRLFQVTLAPSWRVLPIVLAATIIVAILGTLFPVRIVRRIQPAVALKGV
ncbi:MAG: ABC transporter permease [Terriglobia bacterium]